MRRQLERDAPERLKVRMWAYPYLTYLAIAAIVVVVASMWFVDGGRSRADPELQTGARARVRGTQPSRHVARGAVAVRRRRCDG